ncbi:hypothetical protein D9C73_019268 [Collichthys lucidus]|uniref:Uncharacterized protein n=1 Tax=Collichthys lucidus TaxID=240159 RepID=A0A4U5VDA3_COLLU|nr:hypothetical protein D9C73_019268 [Collichthys lucidus]
MDMMAEEQRVKRTLTEEAKKRKGENITRRMMPTDTVPALFIHHAVSSASLPQSHLPVSSATPENTKTPDKSLSESQQEHERIYVRWVKARPLSRDGFTSEWKNPLTCRWDSQLMSMTGDESGLGGQQFCHFFHPVTANVAGFGSDPGGLLSGHQAGTCTPNSGLEYQRLGN